MVAAVVVACLLVLPYAPLRQSLRADTELRYLWREADMIATAGLVAPRVGEWLRGDGLLPLLALTLAVGALVVWRLEWMRRRIGRPWTTLRRRRALDRPPQRAVRRIARRFEARPARR